MIDLNIPGRGRLRLAHLVLDVNGTIAAGGQLVEGVAERLAQLQHEVGIHLVTADTHGRQAELDAQLGTEAVLIEAGKEQEQKAGFVSRLGSGATCFVGNGANDAAALQEAALGIAVVGQEGIALEALRSADVLAPSIDAALDLLLYPTRLIATLRR